MAGSALQLCRYYSLLWAAATARLLVSRRLAWTAGKAFRTACQIAAYALCLWGWLAIIAQGGCHPAAHPPLSKDLTAALSNQYQVGKTRLASQFSRSFHRLYHGLDANYCPAP